MKGRREYLQENPLESRAMTIADLYEAFEDRLHREAVRLARDPHRADDLVQEAFIRAMGHLQLLAQLNPYERRAWLYRTLKNLFLDEQKVRKVQVLGGIVCREENVEALLRRLDDQRTARVRTIPAGFEPVEHPLVLNADTLEGLPGRKLYCTDTVRIEPDVEAEALDGALEALVATEMIICPEALKQVIARKCDMLKTRAIFYQGELWLVEDRHELLPSRFDYLEGKATLVVQGKLTVAPDVEPGVLAERLSKVHNFGRIRCTPEQMGAIQARLGTNEGKLEDSTKEVKAGGERNAIGNVGTLRL